MPALFESLWKSFKRELSRRYPVVCLLRIVGLVLMATPLQSAAQIQSQLPRVLLLGDSIRKGYAPLVAKKLDGVAVVISPQLNGADTTTTLANVEQWLAEARSSPSQLLLVHWNNGLHDVKFSPTSQTHQVPLTTYLEQLQAIVAKIRAVTPHVLFATTTPVLEDRHAARRANFERRNADIQRYNAAAIETLLPLGVPVHDLHRIVTEGDPAKLLNRDGTHFTPAGYDRLAEAVADTIRRHLAILQPVQLKPPASGPEAVRAYQAAEAANDARVPEMIRQLPFPKFDGPATASEWQARRSDVKAKVVASLGDLPPRPAPPIANLVSVELRPGFRIERLRLSNGIDGVMSAMLMIPDRIAAPAPAILWLHSSSYYHPQLLTPNTNGGEEPLGLTFVKRGWVVLAPDAAWYGDRAGQGPAGAIETTTNQQASQLKLNLWFGRTLWGMFVRDDQIALDYLCTRPEVDIRRIGATGISMGSTRSWWLAAVDDRVAAVVGVACLTRYENLIKHGQLRAHGVYYFVYGLLKHFDTEAVVALIAPRPVLFLTGELDAGSPADGIRVIEEKAGGVYATLQATDRFRSVRYPDVGHTYTPEMRREMLAWFDRWLTANPEKRSGP